MKQVIDGSCTPLPKPVRDRHGINLYSAEQMVAFAKEVSAKAVANTSSNITAVSRKAIKEIAADCLLDADQIEWLLNHFGVKVAT